MTTKVVRKIVHIDEEKCNGCGACVPSCREGALQIIDGKAKLVSEVYCDGLGACLGECPQGAITIKERPAEEFSEEAVEARMHEQQKTEIPHTCPGSRVRQFTDEPAATHAHEEPLACGCAGSHVRQFEDETLERHAHEGPPPCGCPSASVAQFAEEAEEGPAPTTPRRSELAHWPVQLTLVPPGAPFLRGADILLAADCVAFSHPGFHEQFLRGHALLVACPKLDDFPAHLAKLTQIIRQAQPRSLTVVHMEVPCCSGLAHMARQAIAASGRDIPLYETVVSVRGEVLEEA